MNKQWDKPPAMRIDAAKSYAAEIKTAKGEIKIALYPQYAPITVNNFVFLAREGYYDNLVFHRVIKNFMIQGGDPTGTGRGGPGYRFQDEVRGNPLKHERCVLSMANAGHGKNRSFLLFSINSSQLVFIVDAKETWLYETTPDVPHFHFARGFHGQHSRFPGSRGRHLNN